MPNFEFIEGYEDLNRIMRERLHVQDKAKHGFSGNYGAGVASNQVGPEGGQVLVDRTVECIREMWGGEPGAAE